MRAVQCKDPTTCAEKKKKKGGGGRLDCVCRGVAFARLVCGKEKKKKAKSTGRSCWWV